MQQLLADGGEVHIKADAENNTPEDADKHFLNVSITVWPKVRGNG
jgi:hypothetical protein